MKKLFFPLLFAICLFFSCNDSKNELIASFSHSESGEAPWDIEFTNTSQNADYFVWDFDDGAITASNSPTHNFYYPGTYHVKLKAYNEEGMDTYSNSLIIKGKAYSIYNGSSHGMYGAISFINLNSGFLEHGYIPVGEFSFPVGQIHKSINYMNVGFILNGFTIVVADPYELENDKISELGVYDYTQVYVLGKSNSSKQILTFDEAVKTYGSR